MSFVLDVLVPQLARPHGLLGQLVAHRLNHHNQALNLHVIAALDLEPGSRVLEVGFGGGVGLQIALDHEPGIALSGVDLSPEMQRRCQKRFGARVRLAQGSVEALPYADGSFDKAFGVNVVYFWPDLARGLAEVRRVLAPGGQLVLGVRGPEELLRVQFDTAGHRVWTPEQYVAALAEAGFAHPRARRVPDPAGRSYVIGGVRT